MLHVANVAGGPFHTCADSRSLCDLPVHMPHRCQRHLRIRSDSEVGSCTSSPRISTQAAKPTPNLERFSARARCERLRFRNGGHAGRPWQRLLECGNEGSSRHLVERGIQQTPCRRGGPGVCRRRRACAGCGSLRQCWLDRSIFGGSLGSVEWVRKGYHLVGEAVQGFDVAGGGCFKICSTGELSIVV